jgi:hypothetical protein
MFRGCPYLVDQLRKVSKPIRTITIIDVCNIMPTASRRLFPRCRSHSNNARAQSRSRSTTKYHKSSKDLIPEPRPRSKNQKHSSSYKIVSDIRPRQKHLWRSADPKSNLLPSHSSRRKRIHRLSDSRSVREEESVENFKTEAKRMAAEFSEMRRQERRYFPADIKKKSSDSTNTTPSSKQWKPKSRPEGTVHKSNATRSKLSKSTASSSPKDRYPPQSKALRSQLPPPSLKSHESPPESTHEYKLSRALLHIPIISEHPCFVCINKPPSVLSQPGPPGEGAILDLLRFQRADLKVQTVNRYISCMRY